MSPRFQNPARYLALVLVLTTSLAACSRTRVLVAPAIDLKPRSRIGLVTFTAQGAKGALAVLATQRFEEHLLRAQPGIEIIELGVIEGPVDAAVAQKLGDERGLRSIITGNLVVSDVRPRVRITGGLRASAEATVSLAAKMLSAESGATLWTQSSQLRQTLGSISLLEGVAVFDAKDPQDAYGEMVDQLVWNLTYDFRSTWVRK